MTSETDRHSAHAPTGADGRIAARPAVRTTVRRSKKQFHLWLDPQTDASLRAAAAQAGMPTTVLAERLIREGLGLLAAERLEGPALPAVRAVVHEEVSRQSERLAGLIVKSFIEAGLGRRLCWSLVHRTYGPDTASDLMEAARTRVMDDLRKKIGAGPAGADAPDGRGS